MINSSIIWAGGQHLWSVALASGYITVTLHVIYITLDLHCILIALTVLKMCLFIEYAKLI